MLHYSSEQLIRVFQKNDKYLNRLYLHSVLHCLFQHLWIGGQRERLLWHVACDIAVEYVIDHLDKPAVQRILGWTREQVYGELENLGSGISAAVVYRYLQEKDQEMVRKLGQEFFADDHRYWPKEEQRQAMPSPARNQTHRDPASVPPALQQISSKTPDSFFCAVRLSSAVPAVFVLSRCHPDEFDLSYYTYGLQIYGNLPLVEPVESSEVKKIQDFVEIGRAHV